MIKRRNMVMQVLLTIVTLGIYPIYWFYVTSQEMLDHKKIDGSPGLWTFLMFIPFGFFYSCWKHSELVDATTESRYSKGLIFVLWVFFSPAVWAITQSELNKLAPQEA